MEKNYNTFDRKFAEIAGSQIKRESQAEQLILRSGGLTFSQYRRLPVALKAAYRRIHGVPRTLDRIQADRNAFKRKKARRKLAKKHS